MTFHKVEKEHFDYIENPELLPAPLKGKEEELALQKLQEGDEEYRYLLIEHNMRLVVTIAKKYESIVNEYIRDLIDIGAVGLIKAINTFEMNKGIKLETYASKCIEDEIVMYLKRNNKI